MILRPTSTRRAPLCLASCSRRESRGSSPQYAIDKSRIGRLDNYRTSRRRARLLIRRSGRRRSHNLTLTNVDVMKVALGSLFPVAFDVGSTGSIRVLGSSARSVSTTLCQGLFRPCPFITLNPLFGRKLPMNKGTLVSLSAFPHGELKARSSVSRILPLPPPLLGGAPPLSFPLPFPLPLVVAGAA